VLKKRPALHYQSANKTLMSVQTINNKIILKKNFSIKFTIKFKMPQMVLEMFLYIVLLLAAGTNVATFIIPVLKLHILQYTKTSATSFITFQILLQILLKNFIDLQFLLFLFIAPLLGIKCYVL
jgi:hypothetical protein